MILGGIIIPIYLFLLLHLLSPLISDSLFTALPKVWSMISVAVGAGAAAEVTALFEAFCVAEAVTPHATESVVNQVLTLFKIFCYRNLTGVCACVYMYVCLCLPSSCCSCCRRSLPWCRLSPSRTSDAHWLAASRDYVSVTLQTYTMSLLFDNLFVQEICV